MVECGVGKVNAARCTQILIDNMKVDYIFNNIRKTHNDAVFSIYTPDIRAARSSHLITGLPDGYGRGRIIGDYRRVALYGINALIEEKKKEFELLNVDYYDDEFCVNSTFFCDYVEPMEII